MRYLRVLVLAKLAFGHVVSLSGMLQGAEPADSLLRLVPPDAGVTLAVEDLRGHAKAFFDSPLAEDLGRLPSVQDWLKSKPFSDFRQARRDVEKVLGVSVATIRDDLLGDAVVLALRVPPGGRQDEARGLLLVRVRDRALLDRLIKGVNAAQKESGELTRVVERVQGTTTYWLREFAGTRPTEYYATLEDNTFAWSNSEEMVQEVIDRKSGKRAGLGHDANFQRVRRRLPARSAASVFVNPRFIEALMAAAQKPSRPIDQTTMTLLSDYLTAVDYAGAALEWRDGFILREEEAINAGKLPLWLQHWARRPSITPRLDRVPSTALAMASAHVDAQALEEIVRELTPKASRRKLDNVLLALGGVMLGNDVKSAILPHLGPGTLAYLEPPASRGAGFSLIAMVDLGGEAGVASALDNALRTLLAVYALDLKHGDGQLQVETSESHGAKLTTLRPTSPFAYAVSADRLVLGKSAESVARALEPSSVPAAGFSRLRAAYFPEVETFVCADLEAIHRFADAHRQAFARRIASDRNSTPEQAARDLDRALALMALFRHAFVTSAISPDGQAIHRTAGLIARGAGPAPRTPHITPGASNP
jgi:hypothetical protein